MQLNIESYVNGFDEEGKEILVYILNKKEIVPNYKPLVSSRSSITNSQEQVDGTCVTNSNECLSNPQQNTSQSPMYPTNENLPLIPPIERAMPTHSPLSRFENNQKQTEFSLSQLPKASNASLIKENSNDMNDSNEKLPPKSLWLFKHNVPTMFGNSRNKSNQKKMEMYTGPELPKIISACFNGKDEMHKQYESSMLVVTVYKP